MHIYIYIPTYWLAMFIWQATTTLQHIILHMACILLQWILTLLIAAISTSRVIHGDVTYDGRSLIINGERKILFSGSIHYPRSTPQVIFPYIVYTHIDSSRMSISNYEQWWWIPILHYTEVDLGENCKINLIPLRSSHI